MADYKENPHGSGWLVRYDDGTSDIFATEQEASDALQIYLGEQNEMAREQDFITEVRQHAKSLWESWLALKSLQEEWNALNYAVELDAGIDANAGITAAQVGAVVFDTADAIDTSVMSVGHATNIARLL